MSKILVILESPNKVAKIKHIFEDFKDGNQYTVKFSAGHITRIKDTGLYNAGIDFESGEEEYEILEDKKDLVDDLKKEVKKADLIYCASDPDIEGEVISYQYIKQLGIPKSKIRRLRFKEITEKGVKDALAVMEKDVDNDKVDAGRCRACIDKSMGYRLSNLSLSKLGAKSAGRVQSAALRILCEREAEIRAFVPEEFYEIWLPFTKDKKEFQAQYKGTDKKKESVLKSQKDADKIKDACKKGTFEVKTITPKERLSNPKDAFTTSTYQQAASTAFGYNPKRSMQIAQTLFERGFITYLRTDSIRLSDDFIKESKALIEKSYGKQYYKGFTGKGKGGAQDGHEAIRPTSLDATPTKVAAELKPDEAKIYKLIYNRALASLMAPAKIEDTEIGIYSGQYKFTITGHKALFDGYLKVYKEEDDEEELPKFKIGEKIKDKELNIVKKQTSPPNRFSEAGMVKTLESSGIGRPSTFASTIETLKDRKYVTLEKKALVPTDLGMQLSEMLVKYFPEVINTNYTAGMETILDTIADGKAKRVDEFLKFWAGFNPMVLKAQREMNKDKPAPEKIGRKCPDCGGELVKRVSRTGNEFIACNKYPKCRHTETIDGDGKEKKPAAEKTGIKCPDCKKGEFVKRVAGKTGEVFYGCSNYPKCRKTMKEADFNETYGKKLKKKKSE